LSSRRRHTRCYRDWSSDVCSSDLASASACSNENISVLQALALAEGLTRTSQRSRTRIIHIEEDTGQRRERIVDLAKILAGKAEDPILRPRDIVFVPNSAARSGMYRGAEAALSMVSGLVVFRK